MTARTLLTCGPERVPGLRRGIADPLSSPLFHRGAELGPDRKGRDRHPISPRKDVLEEFQELPLDFPVGGARCGPVIS